MANDGTIASKLQLDGEQQYKKALNDAYRSLRVLRSELKAETAELGRNATQQDKSRAKLQSLQKQIAEQEKIVRTLEKALEDSKKEYADNQEVQDKWAEKLNKARAALAEMENAMGTCQDELEKFGDGMKDVADNSGEAMQTVISFNDAMKSIGSIAGGVAGGLKDIFTNTVDTMKDMVDEMFSLMSMAWSAAGDWKQIQTIWGGDLESIEKVYTGMALQGVDASQVTSGIQKFVSNVHAGNKDTMEALQELHLSEDQFSSHWDFFVEAMNRASMQKGKGYDLMTALFGDKKGAGMTDVLDNWREAMNKYEEDVEETGLHLYDDEIEKLDEVSHNIVEIQKLWNTVKENVGAKLSDILNMDQLSEDALAILRTVGAILNSEGEHRAELIIKLSDQIETLIKDVSASLENLSGFLQELGGDLKKSDNPLVRFLGQLIEGMGGILDWLGENGDTIVDWLNRLLPFIAANKISEAVTGQGLSENATDLLQLGIDIGILTKMGKGIGAGAGEAIGETAGVLGAGIGAALLKKIPILAGLGIMAEGLFKPGGNDDLPAIKEHGDADADSAPIYGYDKNGNSVIIGTAGEFKTSEYELNNALPEVEESVELPEAVYTLAEKIDAIQDWWDAYRNAETGVDSYEEERSAFDWMAEVLGDELGTFWDTFLQNSEGKDLTKMMDIPEDWYANISAALKNLNKDNYRGDSGEDLAGRISASMESAVKGTKFTIVVQLDGDEVARRTDVTLGSMMSYLHG